MWFVKSRKGGAPARPAFMEYEEAEEEEPELEEPAKQRRTKTPDSGNRQEGEPLGLARLLLGIA